MRKRIAMYGPCILSLTILVVWLLSLTLWQPTPTSVPCRDKYTQRIIEGCEEITVPR